MHKISSKALLTWLAVLTATFYVLATTPSASNPHTVNKHISRTTCTDCHIETPALKDESILNSKNLPVDLSRFSQDGVAMCSTCHNPNQGHKVGLNIDFPVPADLPLNADNDITCLTCHYTHGRLDSDRPQASHSFMDRLMNAERLKKSFLLRRNNSDGELCLTCHNVNQGSNP